MLRVLVICHEYKDFGGGAGRACAHICERLSDRGVPVVLITANWGRRYPWHERNGNLEIFRVPGWRKNALQNRIVPTFLSLFVFGFLLSTYLVLRRRISIVHCFFALPAGVVGSAVGLVTGVPYIVSLRGSDVPFYKKNSVNPLCQKAFQYVCQKAALVVALSNGLKTIAQRSISETTQAVIYNGVDTSHFARAVEVEKEGRQIHLLSVCRLEKIKGIQTLFQALSQLSLEERSRFKYTLVGDGPYRTFVESLAQELQLVDVEFTGFLERDELVRVYSSADLFVLPTHSEAFGQVFTEAMAMGLPVLATRVGGIPEIVKDGEHGWLVEPGDVNALREKLLMISKMNRSELSAMGEKNSAYVSKAFSWESVTQQYEEVYKRFT